MAMNSNPLRKKKEGRLDYAKSEFGFFFGGSHKLPRLVQRMKTPYVIVSLPQTTYLENRLAKRIEGQKEIAAYRDRTCDLMRIQCLVKH